MRECKHTDGDLLFPGVCTCGHLNLPDPSYFIVAIGFLMLGLNVYWWWAL